MKKGMFGVSFLKILAPFFFVTLIYPKSEPLDLEQCKQEAQALVQNKAIDAVYFTPDKAMLLKKLLIGFIDSEKKSIKAALFRFTDKDIAQALIRAKQRGVSVELVVDSGASSLAHYSKVHLVAGNDIPLYVYQSVTLGEGSYKSIMHQKTFIFEDTIGESVVYSGSLNPTHAAFNGNEEVVMIRNAPAFVTAFNQHFEKLKRRSHRYELCNKKQKKHKKIVIENGKKKSKKNRLRDEVLHYHDSFLAENNSMVFHQKLQTNSYLLVFLMC